MLFSTNCFHISLNRVGVLKLTTSSLKEKIVKKIVKIIKDVTQLAVVFPSKKVTTAF